MKRLFNIIFVMLLLCVSQQLYAQLRAFTPRYNNPSARGNIVYVSNSIITSTLGSAATDAAARAEIPPAGTSNNNGSTAYGRNIDVDADASTFNSSSSDLNITSCPPILFAGLYWGAGRGQDVDNSWQVGQNTVRLKLPGSAVYTNVTATQTDFINPVQVVTTPAINYNSYHCFANITALVNALPSPNGTYTVANVVSPATGSTTRDNCFGGWTIVIVYANPSLLPRNLTVFDGCAAIRGGATGVDVNISGFLTPPGGAVSCELGAVVLDGDRGQTDSFAFRQGPPPPAAGAFYNLAQTAVNPMSGTNDMWNSSITYKGATVTTRNPAYQNTLGYDADIIDLPNAANARLGNSQTQATVRFATPSESYSVYVLTSSISIYNPSFSFDKTATDLNAGALNPGDILRYQVNYTNVGNDGSTNTIITDNIPAGTTYVPGSLFIGGVAKTDAAGDDEAEYDFVNNRVRYRIGTGANAATGGSVASTSTGFVRFNVVTPSSCLVASCTGPIRNSARVDYRGATSNDILLDSSGVLAGGCVTDGPVISTLSASCYVPVDTVVRNACPALTLTLPYLKYGGYSFYSAMPFIAANAFNPATTISATRTYYAYYNSGAGCVDTVIIHAFITACPDIDDDNDGIPDYVEINDPLALQNHNADPRLNWNDPAYPGWVDNNADNFNDNFDPAADSDADGIPNFYDVNFPGYVDTNGDHVNDNMDKDQDGIPNNYDLDSDNDGVPDVVESLGVDVLGDGRIDGYTDPDSDGLSQNVDGSTGLNNSGAGLGAINTDGDPYPNFLDLDSDNDGIPDIVEVYGTDANNNGKVDVFLDIDGDGYADAVDGDVGNDGTAENSGASLLLTGTDVDNNGRADNYPNKNLDSDARPNLYDLDSDGDGITDVKEALFTDSDFNAMIDGAINTNGWNTAIAGAGTLGLPNTDGSGRQNVYDIDSDNDGIPDNIEGQLTIGYILPSGADGDLDGIDNSYDNLPAAFGGNGTPYPDKDGDSIKDYMDLDTDNDGLPDILEGHDLNGNGLLDDNIVPANADTDGDGLDNFFDLVSTVKGTSIYMGNGGSLTGDPSPGGRATVQRSYYSIAAGCVTERDWRCLGYVLSCNTINFKSVLQNQLVTLDWAMLCSQNIKNFIVQRSAANNTFTDVTTVAGRPTANVKETYSATDEITGIAADIIYYRLKIIAADGKIGFSNTIAVQQNNKSVEKIQIVPNPVIGALHINISTAASSMADIYVIDANGKLLQKYKEQLLPGTNSIVYDQTANLSKGVYYLRVNIGGIISTRKFNVVK